MKHKYLPLLFLVVFLPFTIIYFDAKVFTSRSGDIVDLWTTVGQYYGNPTFLYDAKVDDVDSDGILEVVSVGYVNITDVSHQLLVIWNVTNNTLSLEYYRLFKVGDLIALDIHPTSKRIFIVGRNNESGTIYPILAAGMWNGSDWTSENITLPSDRVISSIAVNKTDSAEVVLSGVFTNGTSIVVSFSYSPGNFVIINNITWEEREGLTLLIPRRISLYGSNIYVSGYADVFFGIIYANFIRQIYYAENGSLVIGNLAKWHTGGGMCFDFTVSDYVYAVGIEQRTSRIWLFERNTLIHVMTISSVMDTIAYSLFVTDADLDLDNEIVVVGFNNSLCYIDVWNSKGYFLESRYIWNFSEAAYCIDVEVYSGYAFAIGYISNRSVFVKMLDLRDRTPPNIQIIAPENGEIVYGNVRIEVNVTDDASPLSHVEFYVNDTLIGNVSSPPYSIYWDSSQYTPGPYNLTVVAYDYLRNSNATSIIFKVKDVYPPEINITSPLEGSTLVNESQIVANISDGTLIRLVQVFIDGNIFLSREPLNRNFFLNETIDPQQFSNGTHIITLIAVDEYGYQRSSSVSVNVLDITPPSCSIVNIRDNDTVSGNVSIIVSRSDSSGISEEYLLINGTIIALSDNIGTWDTSQFPIGIYNITYFVKDSAGNINRATVFVTLKDGIPPILMAMTPEDKVIRDDATIILYLHDPSGIRYVDISLGTFTARLTPLLTYENGTTIFSTRIDYNKLQDG
ncbi:MAG: Ig-like domain-containing protein, partial [Candidatus Korarchaeota archaeon]